MKNNFFFSFITITSRLLAGLLIILILANIFTLRDFGIYTYALVIANLIASIVEYGYNTLLTKELAKAPILISTYTTQTMVVKLIMFFLTSLLFYLYTTLSEEEFEPIMIQSIIFVSLAVTLNSFIVHLLVPYKIINKFYLETKYALINNISTFIIVSSVAYATKNVLYTSISFFLAKLFLFVYISFKFKQTFSFKLKKFGFLNELRKATPYALMTILGGLYLTVDTVVIKMYVSIEDVGLYRAGFNIIFSSVFITSIFNNVALPKLSSLKSKHLLLSTATIFNRYIILIGFIVSIFIYLLQDFLIVNLYGNSFVELVHYMPYIIGIIFLRYIESIYGLLLTIADKQMIRVLFVALTVILIISLNFYLVPSMKLQGAFVSMLIGQVFLIALYIGFTVLEHKTILLKN